MDDIKKAKRIASIDNLNIMIEFPGGDKRILDIGMFCTGNLFKPFLTNVELFKSAKLDCLGGI